MDQRPKTRSAGPEAMTETLSCRPSGRSGEQRTNRCPPPSRPGEPVAVDQQCPGDVLLLVVGVGLAEQRAELGPAVVQRDEVPAPVDQPEHGTVRVSTVRTRRSFGHVVSSPPGRGVDGCIVIRHRFTAVLPVCIRDRPDLLHLFGEAVGTQISRLAVTDLTAPPHPPRGATTMPMIDVTAATVMFSDKSKLAQDLAAADALAGRAGHRRSRRQHRRVRARAGPGLAQQRQRRRQPMSGSPVPTPAGVRPGTRSLAWSGRRTEITAAGGW